MTNTPPQPAPPEHNKILLPSRGSAVQNPDYPSHTVPFLWTEDIDATTGAHRRISLQQEVQTKLQELLQTLNPTDMIVIGTANTTKASIQELLQGNTIVTSKKNVHCEPLKKDDTQTWETFLAHYKKHSTGENPLFRERSPEELSVLQKNMHVLTLDGATMGTFALTQKSGGWLELSTLCSMYTGSRIGDLMLEAAKKVVFKEIAFKKEQAKKILKKGEKRAKSFDKIYAFSSSDKSRKVFQRNDFKVQKEVSKLKHDHPYEQDGITAINLYDTKSTGRDPVLCVWKAESLE